MKGSPMPLAISTIVPTHRRPAELREALASVLAQEGPLQVLVVDDSLGAEGKAVVEALGDARVRWLAMPEPTGGVPARVRNFGLAQASGELIHFLDDDDLVPQGHYARARALFDGVPALGALFGRVQPFGLDLCSSVRRGGRLDAALLAAWFASLRAG